MKERRHHNNTGYRQIKRGKTRDQVKRIASKLGIKYGRRKSTDTINTEESSISEDNEMTQRNANLVKTS